MPKRKASEKKKQEKKIEEKHIVFPLRQTISIGICIRFHSTNFFITNKRQAGTTETSLFIYFFQ